jgi:hypothetical protein
MLLIWVATTHELAAADAPQVAWRHDQSAAWKEAVGRDRPLLVFVTHPDCLYCKQMKDGTYADPTVVGVIKDSFVPLMVDSGTDEPWLKKLDITAYPSTLVIASNAVILDRIVGYLRPDGMFNRLNALRPTLPVAKADRSR